jgi:hypothetical protein
VEKKQKKSTNGKLLSMMGTIWETERGGGERERERKLNVREREQGR